jgi:hypothetical protein
MKILLEKVKFPAKIHYYIFSSWYQPVVGTNQWLVPTMVGTHNSDWGPVSLMLSVQVTTC